MHRYTFYAISLIVVTLLLSMTVPYFSLISIILLIILFSSQDRKPFVKRQTYRDYPYSAPLDSVPPQYYTLYRLYLSSDEWKHLRSIVLLRDSHTCQDCGATTSLQVHHLHYDGIQTMTFTSEQCVSLCESCHTLRHS